jgi:hypothetical protein
VLAIMAGGSSVVTVIVMAALRAHPNHAIVA